MEKLKTWASKRWGLLIFLALFAAVAAFLLTYRIGSLNHGATLGEVDYVNSLRSGKNLLVNPIFLMHKLPTYLLFKLGVHSVVWYRLVSVAIAILSLTCLFILLARDYSLRIAVLGSTLFLTSAWFLHIVRSATPESAFLLLPPLVLAVRWLHVTTHHNTALLTLSALLVISCYIPGFWLLAVSLIVWEHKAIMAALRAVRWWVWTICGLILVIGFLPLVWAIAHHGSVLLAVSGLPTHVPSLRQVGKNIISVPERLFVTSRSNPANWLGHIPILDVFSSVMLIVGLYSLRYHLKEYRFRMLMIGSIAGVIWISLGGLVTITMLIPIIYLLIAGGIAFMLQQWLTVFPRNPLAKTLATTLLSLTVLLVVSYHLDHYFIAWPQTPATKQVYGYSLLK